MATPTSPYEDLIPKIPRTNRDQAKIRLTKTPPLPSKCSSCGVPAKGRNQFIDFDLSIDYYGAVIFCMDCTRSICDLLGYVSEKQVDIVGSVVKRLEDEREELKKKVESLEQLAATYGFSAPAESTADSDSVSLFSNDVEDESADKGLFGSHD